MRKESNITRQHNSNKKRIVKNENYYAYKKKSFIKKSIIVGSTLVVVGVCWYTKEVPVKAEMIVNNNTVEWTTKKENLKGITFQVFKNGKVILETDKLEFTDENQIDKVAPNQVSEIKTHRGINSFKVLWQEPLDNGNDNTYQIFAVNKHGRKLFKTEEVQSSFASGVSKYKIKFNNQEFETEKPEFYINIDDLKNDEYVVEIKTIDKAGNESEFKKFNFKFDMLEFDIIDNKLVPKNSLYTSQDYNFYIVDENLVSENKEIAQYDKKMFLLNQDIFTVLGSGIKPTMSIPSYNIKNNTLNLTWSNANNKKNDYSFYVEAVNKITFDKIYSDLINVSGSSKVLGYHYRLDANKEYTVSSTDNYVESNSLSINISNLDKNKKYYFHLATMDNNGLLSDTKTITIDLNKKSSLTDSLNILKRIVSKTTGTTSDEYSKVLNSIAKNFTLNKIESLEKLNIKIHIIKDNFKEYLKESYNIDANNDTCIKSGNSIYFNISQPVTALIEMVSSLIK